LKHSQIIYYIYYNTIEFIYHFHIFFICIYFQTDFFVGVQDNSCIIFMVFIIFPNKLSSPA
jgi:hypothetical protein